MRPTRSSMTAVAFWVAGSVSVGCGGLEDSSNGERMGASSAAGLVGWAALSGDGVNGTSGGGTSSPVVVTSLGQLASAASGTTPRVITVSGTISGSVSVGSNKTIQGAAGAVLHGHIQMTGSANVIVRNLTVVGYDWSDDSDCQNGADAITVKRGHHLWFDHDDISDGSDGNLDITHGSDDITVSWTKFHYSGNRSGGHQLSTLIGHSDSNGSEDSGHLKVTFHHDWWADHVVERMPRVRFGKVHVFNSLFTASGDDSCIRAGVSSRVLVENNAFVKVKKPFDLDGGGLVARGNVFLGVSGNRQGSGSAFSPPYPYTLESASALAGEVESGAGPH